jgi:ABC-2 type transport system permease protein
MAAFGLGFGSIVRNQVFAVIGLIIWLFIVETTLTSVAPGVGKFFPMAAADAMSGVEAEKILTASQGALLLVGYVIALFIAGTAITRRLDVK